MNDLKLAIIEPNSNWDLYVNKENYFSAIAKVEGAKDSHFGNKFHVAKLLNDGYLKVENITFTEEGLKSLSGIHSAIIFNDDGFVKSSWIRF